MSEATALYDRLLEIALLLQQDMATSFVGTGLTTARAHLLWVLEHSGPSTQQALATALDVTPRNVTGLVDALESHSFVERGPHPSDRRATLVRLTAAGEQATAAMVADRQAIAARLVEGFAADRLERLAGDLDTLVERLRGLGEAQ